MVAKNKIMQEYGELMVFEVMNYIVTMSRKSATADSMKTDGQEIPVPEVNVSFDGEDIPSDLDKDEQCETRDDAGYEESKHQGKAEQKHRSRRKKGSKKPKNSFSTTQMEQLQQLIVSALDQYAIDAATDGSLQREHTSSSTLPTKNTTYKKTEFPGMFSPTQLDQIEKIVATTYQKYALQMPRCERTKKSSSVGRGERVI